MALNPNIILAGQAPDIVGAMDRGAQAGQRAYQQRRSVLLDEFLGQNGAAVMQGDAGALGGLARFDPSAALGIQDQRQQMASRVLGMRNTRQGMAFDAERAAQLRAQARREAEQHASQMDAATRQAEAQKITTILKGAASAYQRGDRAGYEGWLRQNGLDPAQYRFEDFEAHAAMQAGVLDALTGLRDYNVGPKPADEYERYVREETNKGLVPLSRIDYAQAIKGKGVSYSFDPSTGATSFSVGGAQSSGMPPGQNPAVTATPRDSGKMAKNLSDADAKMIEGARELGTAASDLESIAKQMDALQPDVGYTGAFGNAYDFADKVMGDALPGSTGARAAFQSLSTDARLTFTAKTKGAITEAEMALFASAVPGLTQTPDGNRMISQVLRAGARRVQERAQFFEQYAAEKGSLEGALEVWSRYMSDNPLLERGDSGLIVNEGGDWRSYIRGDQGAGARGGVLSDDDLLNLYGDN